MSEELVSFFKALADSNRLKILGLLAQKPYSVEQLAAILHLRPSTISHHLSRLAEVKLVSAKAESYYNIYQLEEDTLQKIRLMFSQEDLVATVKDVDLNAYDRNVIESYTLSNGRLKSIPSQPKKLDVILRYIVKSFKPGEKYTDKQVNKILSRFHDDSLSLKRELVSFGLINEQGGAYLRSKND